MSQSRQSVNDIEANEYNQYSKRSRVSSDSLQGGMVASTYPAAQQYYTLEEPSPLGLQLNKTPLLVEHIQKHLAQSNGSMLKPVNSGETTIRSDQSLAGINDKLKVSNIPSTHLKIGNWEFTSRHEGDLVAKFFFVKHKIIWEMLESGLKSRIEIAWSDVTGLKADCPQTGESSLRLVLARQPLFFRETDPHPRKHSQWQPYSEFTGGEATLNRIHFLKFPQGTLQKHYEKLIQNDSRLNFLSRQPDIAVDSPHFEGCPSSVMEDLDPKYHLFNSIKAGESAPNPGYPDTILPTEHTVIQPSHFTIGQQGHGEIMLEQPPVDYLSPSSVMAGNPTEGIKNQTSDVQGAGTRSSEQFKEQTGLCTSMSKLHVMICLVNMIPSVADPSYAEALQHKDLLENLSEYLLDDTDMNTPIPTDEKSLMASANSLSSLLQKDNVEGCNSLKENNCDTPINSITMAMQNMDTHSVFENIGGSGGEEPAEDTSMEPETGMTKKDSFSDMLLHLPDITSLPMFMNFSEDD